MNREDLKKIAVEEIDKNRDEIVQLGNSILMEPEEGFREFKTSKKIEDFFKKMEIEFKSGLAITGIKGYLSKERKGPSIGIIGELDALFNPEHPLADGKNGLAHACGHFAQIASMIGTGIGLAKVINYLDGNVVLFGVPAEEYINLEFRERLRKEEKIKFFGGKQELIRIGEFDDIDIAIMTHAQSSPERKVFIPESSNSFVGKNIKFIGKASHAGYAPFSGINALNAFNVALSAIHAQRETFRDEDAVRVHLIVTKGGDSVNIVPSEIKVEMYVRAKTIEAVEDAALKVDRALKGGALSVGCKVEITQIAGYLQLNSDKNLSQLWANNATAILGEGNVQSVPHFGGSTDMGDITNIKPGIHPSTGGFEGEPHTKDFKIVDEEMAYILPAKINALTVIDLLFNNAEKGKGIIVSFRPKFTKEEYLKLLDSLNYQVLWPSDEKQV